MNEITPVSSRERIEILDVLRGLAVCGILIGNVQWFSGYGMMPPALEAQTPIYDQVTHFLVHFFVEGKFYSIFSFLFGIGFIAPLTAQIMVAWNIDAPFGMTPVAFGLLFGGSWGLLTQIRGRWV